MRLEHRSIAFPRLDDGQIAALRAFATPVRFAPGGTLFAAGDIDTAFFVIEQGEVAIVDRSEGRDETVAVHQAGEFTGDADTLTGRRR
jgi:thioredoxin reductase (NADPH)